MSLQKNRFLFLSVLIIIFVISSTVLTAAEKNPQKAKVEEEITIAFVPRSLENPIFLDAFEHSQKKAVELGVNLEWLGSFSFDTDEQLNIIDSLIKREVDGMVLSINDSPEYDQIINRAMEKGIAVATFDADAPNSDRIFNIGIDNYEAGKATAEGLLQVLSEKDINYQDSDKKLKTMVMTGVKGALNLEKRIDAFLDTVEGTNIVVEDIVENQDNVNLAVELLEQYVQKNPDVDIIFFVGGWPFYVPAEALPNFQHWAQEGGVAVGIDIFYDALVLQDRGLIHYLVGQDMAAMGSEGLLALYNYIEHGIKPPEYIKTDLEIANKDNLERLLRIHLPWRVK
ncbi:MAG: substrate-binding domain-containing protein [Halanaerobium sp.]